MENTDPLLLGRIRRPSTETSEVSGRSRRWFLPSWLLAGAGLLVLATAYIAGWFETRIMESRAGAEGCAEIPQGGVLESFGVSMNAFPPAARCAQAISTAEGTVHQVVVSWVGVGPGLFVLSLILFGSAIITLLFSIRGNGKTDSAPEFG